jgi:hypothetical protein
MSAPAGWHLQPDGRERYWDGTRWTEEFRAPLPNDPTAPPADASWQPSVDETQALDVEHTQSIPAPAPGVPEQPAWGSDPAQGAQPGYEQPNPYGQPAGYAPQGQYQGQYPQQGQNPQTGYGAPGSLPYAPPARSNGIAKGCLVAAILGFLVLALVVVAGFFLFNRAVDKVGESFPSGFPTSLPSDFPSDLPTEGLGQQVEVSVGDGFDLPRGSIESGWSLEAQPGASIVNIVGMKATLSSGDGFPVLFTMAFPDRNGTNVETVCTTTSGSSGDTVDVTCVPLFGDVADATRASVTASL